MPGSVSIKSTGFKAPAVKYSNTENNNSDANAHPNAASQNPKTMGRDDGREYVERPAAGIEKMGVGSMACNDAACEKIARHPDADDLRDGGTMGTARVMS